eukprot:TRINITY_DN8908_c0_g2_i2.p1 TRINITY_DN8908_c0_g2~~TRINITY_DN8908_c0_g2_i2.p1  ORF type:complete len:525 (+),score=90.53 TRINITY_DN8908_c0_g2_i2:22-1596(+)
MAPVCQQCCCRAPSHVDPSFAEQVEADRRKRARKHLLSATVVAVLFIIYALAFFDPSHPLRMPYRVNNFVSLGLVLTTYAFSAVNMQCERHLDIFIFFIAMHFVTYNSISLRRLKALTSPMLDHYKYEIEDDVVDEFDTVLVSYLAVALTCHLQMLSTKFGFALCFYAPAIWVVQAITLGSVLPDIITVSVVYFLMSLVAFLGLKRSHDVLLQSQWEMYGMGNRRQQEAMRGIMDHLCECVLNLNDNFQLTADCPSLRSLLFLSNTSLAGFDFAALLSSESDKENLESIKNKVQPGVLPIWLKDAMNKVVRTHIYYASYDDEGQRHFMVGVVENQEGHDRAEAYESGQLKTVTPDVFGQQSSEMTFNSESSSQSSQTQTLSRQLDCSDEDMFIMLDLETGTIVQTSQTMQEFLGTSLERIGGPMWKYLRTPTRRAVHKKLAELANSVAGRKSYTKLQDFCLEVPTEGKNKSIRFRASSCKVESIIFYDDDEEGDSTQIAKLTFPGDKHLFEMPRASKWMRQAGQ